MVTGTDTAIKELLRKQVSKDAKLHNAYLLVHSDKLGVHLNIAEGKEGFRVSPTQPNYMASVGKLFTATVVAKLSEEGRLSFDDPIAKYLPDDLISRLHVYKGTDYSGKIQVRHLLNQTSGLPDNFWPLFKQLLADPQKFHITPQQAIQWAKDNQRPHAPLGEKCKYTDTNYHLLGLIIEDITGKLFHEALSTYIFDPLGMKHSYMLNYSRPEEAITEPEAGFYVNGKTKINTIEGYAGLDYAGGGVVAPMEDLLTFMKALVANKIVSKATLEIMKNDKAKLTPNFDYGYAIWQLKPVPLLIPEKFRSWGVLGATGAFLFYHPKLDTYLAGSFNDTSYQRKSVRFMMKIFNQLYKHEKENL